jgi:sugar O-acyltransferase (sialic acid O-acetyltransferase NeuD family)
VTRKLLIFGTGGFAREVAWIVSQRSDSWDLLGFLDDDVSKWGQVVGGQLVLGDLEEAIKFSDCSLVVAVGAPRARWQIVQRLKALFEARFATLSDPAFQCSKSVWIGSGSMLCKNSVVTVDTKIGGHLILNLGATVGHDCAIGDFVTIAPQAAISGNVTLEDGVEVGTGALIRQGVRIGRGAMVGMGAVVLSDVPANACVVGNPARVIRQLPPFGEAHD